MPKKTGIQKAPQDGLTVDTVNKMATASNPHGLGWSYSPTLDGVTWSMLKTWQECRYKAMLHILGIRPQHTSKALQIGSYVHELIEHNYPVQDILPNVAPGPNEPEEAHSRFAFAMALVEARYEHFRKRDSEYSWAALEEVCKAPDPGSGVLMVGKVDGLVQLPKSKAGEVWLLERKTHSGQNEENFLLYLAVHGQIRWYANLVEKAMGFKVKGVIFETIKKPSHRLKQNETVEQYRQRVKDVISTSPDDYFARYEIYLPETRMKEFKRSISTRLIEYWDWANSILPSYRNESACMVYGACPFLEICATGNINGYKMDGQLMEEIPND